MWHGKLVMDVHLAGQGLLLMYVSDHFIEGDHSNFHPIHYVAVLDANNDLIFWLRSISPFPSK